MFRQLLVHCCLQLFNHWAENGNNDWPNIGYGLDDNVGPIVGATRVSYSMSLVLVCYNT